MTQTSHIVTLVDRLKSLARVLAAITLVMAVATLGVLPPEHIHDAIDGGQVIHHRHAIDSAVASHGPTVHADDHSTVKLIAAVFDVSPSPMPGPALIADSPALCAPVQTSAGRLMAHASPPIHGPPVRLAPSRAPPRS